MIPKNREHTGRSPKVGREGEPRRRKMRKLMEEWLEKEKEVEFKAESQKTKIGEHRSKGKEKSEEKERKEKKIKTQ